MSFRTIVIKERAKIEVRLNWLVVRGNEEKYIFLSEIYALIIESTACAITTHALCELAKNNAIVIFCDQKHLPYGEMSILYGNYSTSGQVIKQAKWKVKQKNKAWQEIVRQKLVWQKYVLTQHGCDTAIVLLDKYMAQIQEGDKTNREGHAAKVYFNALFGLDFCRRNENDINTVLNYGYAILMSTVAREIIAAGYITQLGIHHINENNKYNLACDLMEPFRPIVDLYVLSLSDYSNFKNRIIRILSVKVLIYEHEQFLENAIRIYVRSVFDYMNNGEKMPTFEKIIFNDTNE